MAWADSKERLAERIGTILGEFAAGPDDLVHLGYSTTQTGWRDVWEDASGRLLRA